MAGSCFSSFSLCLNFLFFRHPPERADKWEWPKPLRWVCSIFFSFCAKGWASPLHKSPYRWSDGWMRMEEGGREGCPRSFSFPISVEKILGELVLVKKTGGGQMAGLLAC